MRKIFIVLLILSPFLATAQNQETDVCVQNIELAQQRYDEGRIQDIQGLLAECLEKGSYNKAQKTQALRLMTLSYIFLEDVKLAEATMLELLKTEHEFVVNPVIDPTEFINLHDQFRYKPVFNLGIRYIFNFAQPIVTGLNSSLSLTSTRPNYDLQFGVFGIGINFEYEFADNFILYPEVHYKSMAIFKVTSQNGVSTDAPYITTENYEEQNWLSVPISVKYNFSFENTPSFHLYANLGGSLDYLLNAQKLSDKTVLKMPNDPEVGFTYSTTKDKNRLNFGVFAGGGATIKVGEGFLSLEARYLYSLTKLTKDENILNPQSAVQLNTGVQDDIYRLNHIAISIGYTANIYLPKQLR